VVEKKTKLKFLATSLISSQNLFKKAQKHKMKEAFQKWHHSVSMRRLAVNAFNRVVELNHRHSVARYRAAVYLLTNIKGGCTLQNAFDRICQAAQMRKAHHYIHGGIDTQEETLPTETKTRSRSRGGRFEQSYNLNNISSLLSPLNMRKVEQKSLYQQMIKSFYSQVDPSRLNYSSLPNNLLQTNFADGSAINVVQMQPEQVQAEVVGPRRSQSRDNASLSRYSVGNTNVSRVAGKTNPYQDVNLS
jgi:hypothetical protein